MVGGRHLSTQRAVVAMVWCSGFEGVRTSALVPAGLKADCVRDSFETSTSALPDDWTTPATNCAAHPALVMHISNHVQAAKLRRVGLLLLFPRAATLRSTEVGVLYST